MLPLAAGAAVTLGTLASSALGQTWIAPAAGNWNVGTNWQGSVPPVSDPTTALVFTSGNAAAITATNNIGTPFVLNSLTFNVNNAFSVNGSATAWLFQLAGTSPSINMSGVGSATFTGLGGSIQLTSDLTLNVAGPGSLTLNGAISDDFATTGNHRALTVAGGAPVRAWRLVTLGAANTFSGGLTLDGGAVLTANGNVTTFGPNGSTLTVTPNGGMIVVGSTLSTTLGTIQLDGDVHFLGGALTLLGSSGQPTVVQGAGTFNMNFATSGLTINSDSSGYTGAVVIDQSQLPNMGTASAGILTLNGVGAQSTFPNGSLHGVPSFDVRAGGLLQLNNNLTDSLQNSDRIGDSTPVRLRSGNLTLTGPAVAGASGYSPVALTENIGDLSGAGHNTVTVSPASNTVTTTLNANSLVRLDRGTFIFRGAALGDGITGTRGRVTLTNAPAGSALVGGGGPDGSQNISILPYAAGGTSTIDNGTSLITYGADGFRPLTTFEYDSAGSGATLAIVSPDNNVRLTAATSNTTTITMNALVLANDGATHDASVTGIGGTLNITSGVLIVNPRNATSTTPIGISNDIGFGGAEGVVYVPGSEGVKITGNLTGSNEV